MFPRNHLQFLHPLNGHRQALIEQHWGATYSRDTNESIMTIGGSKVIQRFGSGYEGDYHLTNNSAFSEKASAAIA